MSLRLCCILLSLGCPRGCAALSPSCPAGCCCPHPDALVFCESLGLTSLPRFIPRNTSVLSVARNLLCNMDHLLQNFSSLQVLNLSHNHLDRFPRGLPPSLESLQLQENRITYITTRALKQLRKLVQLDLEDNRIRAMQPRALLTLSRLERLSLKGNFLSSLPLFLPPSLTHLDVSGNCISALDMHSLDTLINLQVLKINRNCLQSVPEAAFDGLSRLHFVDLANNLWTCECDIMYLYRWLLDGRLGLAGDLVCAAPLHLAHRLLLTLSVMAICPRVLKQNEEAPPLNSTLPTSLRNSPAVETKFSVRLSKAFRQSSKIPKSPNLQTRVLLDLHSVEGLRSEDCLSLNKSHSPSMSTDTPISPSHCLEDSTTVASTAPGLLVGGEVHSVSTAEVHLNPGVLVLTAVLILLCFLTCLLLVAVVWLLKTLLQRNQRVVPLQQS